MASWDFNFGGIGGMIFSGIAILFWATIIFTIIAALGWWLWSKARNKNLYTNPVRLIKLFENGSKKNLHGLKGGKVRRNGIGDFVIKYPKGFKRHYLGYTPDFSKADADGTITFITSGDGTLWQQVEEKLDRYETVTREISQEEIDQIKQVAWDSINKNYPDASQEDKENLLRTTLEMWIKQQQDKSPKTKIDLLLKPIPTEIKTKTINDMMAWKQILDKNKLTVYGIAIGAFIIMVIAHLVSLYIQTKIKCPTP